MPERRITSRQNERIKQAARLHHARDRAEQGRFAIDGIREIGRAIEGGTEVLEAFACEELLASDEATALVERLEAADVPVWQVDRDLFAKVAYGARHEGLVAIARLPEFPLAALKLPADALVAVLVGIEKPGNVGAVLRSADGAGVSAVVVADGGTDLLNPNTIRASLGTVFTVPIAVATGAETLAWLREQGVTIYAARPDAEQNYGMADFAGPTAIVLGSEAEGLGADWHVPDVRPIKLPMHGAADSLNVSAAAAVLLYEARRQRDQRTPKQP
jgi:TrmH family RNA methyltransferase